MILTDNETKIDLLNNEAIAATIIQLLKERPDAPVTIGVHGDWGAGKSSVLEMIEANLAGEEKILCLKFNGWRFQGFEDAKIALIEGIVTGLVEKKPALKKATGALKDVFKRIDWLKIAKKGGGLAWTAFTGIPTPDQIGTVISTVQGLIGNPGQLVTKENTESVAQSIGGLLKSADPKHLPEEVREFREAFDKLLTEAGIGQLVVLIDDLDRCLPDTTIETLEAIRLFVFTNRTAFVVAADEAMVEYAVRKHFPELPDTSGPRDYARNYLEKLIQIPFRIPALGEPETQMYVSLLLIGAQLDEGDTDFNKLIGVARAKMQKPWIIEPLDHATVKSFFSGKKEKMAIEALTLSEQVAPLLAGGTMGNPRQIKRFLNTLILRKKIAEARGFGDEINLSVLAKFMLAERFTPKLFDLIATEAATAEDGLSSSLATLELEVEKEEKMEIKDSGVNEWLSDQQIVSWLKLEPPMTKIDLKPYLFVAKDKKDYFGNVTALGRLRFVAERLLGPQLVVRGMMVELKQLAVPEAEQVFEAIRSRVVASGSFKTQPQGIEGLKVLVEIHQNLQSNLLDFLDGLPTAQLGAWVVNGWDLIIKDAVLVERLKQLRTKWNTTANNKPLNIAASAALRIPKSR